MNMDVIIFRLNGKWVRNIKQKGRGISKIRQGKIQPNLSKKIGFIKLVNGHEFSILFNQACKDTFKIQQTILKARLLSY